MPFAKSIGDEAPPTVFPLLVDAPAAQRERRRAREAAIRAPFAGVVVARETQLGEFIQPGATVVRLVNTERLEVRAHAPVSLGATLRAGDAVTLKDGMRSDIEQIRAVVPVGDAQSRQLEVRIAVDDATWPIGAALEVALPLGSTASVVAVPRDALILRGRRPSCSRSVPTTRPNASPSRQAVRTARWSKSRARSRPATAWSFAAPSDCSKAKL